MQSRVSGSQLGESARLSQRRPGEWQLEGPLEVSSVPHILKAARGGLFQYVDHTVVDLSSVTRIDSAGLALLIEWLREGKARNVTLRYENIPARMLPVAQACGVTALIPEEWFQTADLGLEVAQ